MVFHTMDDILPNKTRPVLKIETAFHTENKNSIFVKRIYKTHKP